MRIRNLALVCAAGALTVPSAPAQSNAVPGMDIRPGAYGPLTQLGRLGNYPTGEIAVSGLTTVCNVGTESIAWSAPMNENHPLFGFMVVREDADRIVQISDYSRVKHPFAAINASACTPCSGQGFGLRPGCSDTYGSGTNGSRFWLGPADEVDPWLSTWTAFGSLFDGVPVDGQRDYQGVEPNDVIGRIRISDAELDVAGSTYYHSLNMLQEGEPAANRGDNLGWQEFTFTRNGDNYSFSNAGPGMTLSPVTMAWDGASHTQANNFPNDGTVHIAYKVTPIGGGFHYEYALYNQDNNRQIGEFRLPVDPNALVTNFFFRDIDDDAGNQWSAQVVGNEIVFQTSDNPLAWNSIYNFAFDADVGPASAFLDLGQFFGGLGADTISANALAPLGDAATNFCFGNGGLVPGCTDCPCGNNAVTAGGGCMNSLVRSAVLEVSGTPSLMSDTLHFEVIEASINTFAILASADNLLPQSGPCPVGSGIVGTPALDGLRCIGGNLRRHGSRALDFFGTTASAGWGPPDNPPAGIAAQSGFVAGQIRNFQVFYREDPMLGCNTGQNTTNAIRVTFEP